MSIRLPTLVLRTEILTSWLTVTDCTRSELARRLGVSKGRVSQLLTSKREPPAHLIAKLITLTDLPFERLFQIIHKKAPSKTSIVSSDGMRHTLPRLKTKGEE